MNTEDPRRRARVIVHAVLVDAAKRDDAVGDAARAELQRRAAVAREQWVKLVAGVKSAMATFAATVRRTISAFGVTRAELEDLEEAARNPESKRTP